MQSFQRKWEWKRCERIPLFYTFYYHALNEDWISFCVYLHTRAYHNIPSILHTNSALWCVFLQLVLRSGSSSVGTCSISAYRSVEQESEEKTILAIRCASCSKYFTLSTSSSISFARDPLAYCSARIGKRCDAFLHIQGDVHVDHRNHWRKTFYRPTWIPPSVTAPRIPRKDFFCLADLYCGDLIKRRRTEKVSGASASRSPHAEPASAECFL